MSKFVEIEIQKLLNDHQDLDIVCDHLIQHLEKSPEHFTSDNIAATALFLHQAEKPLKLIQFVVRHIENESFPTPWPYFLEALGKAQLNIDEKTKQALLEGLQESSALANASRSKALDSLLPELIQARQDRKYHIHKDYLNNKKTLLDQLVTLRTQQLYEQEKLLLQRLQKLYPGDFEILREAGAHKQRYALEVLQKRSPKSRQLKEEDFIEADPELDKALAGLLASLREHAEQSPEMAFDFAIAAFMLESYEAALDILNFSEQTSSVLWFRLEVLLRCRRFVQVLNELSKVELQYANDPETFFSTAYLRAQALWGLGQKHTALEVLESLLSSRPHYRAASALHSIWSGQ
ncbi:MAG: hypothetical protein HUU57_07935 [Bdellovibrio sp.]|nr:hypothetical protein [Bdellovibrio sp.]